MDTLEAVGIGKLGTLPNCLNELTKAINDVEDITRAYGSQFKVVEARSNDLEKRVLKHENTLKKIGEQSQNIMKAFVDSFGVMINKLEHIHQEKNTIDTSEDKVLTLEGGTIGHGKRT